MGGGGGESLAFTATKPLKAGVVASTVFKGSGCS